ncbi:TPA: hypothetical protein U9H55_001342 [Streptococcus agalactiae]|nr:hypothetical protein [Streptococcus agalactiae]
MKDRLYNKFKDFDREFCQKYIKTYQSNAYQEMKASVNLMMRNTFVFNDNWDMEPCSKAYCLDPLEWDKPVTDDPEWLYMLNRQTYLFKFLVVYIVEGDKSYLRQMKYFMYHWIDCQFTLKPEGAVSRTIDTGKRWLLTLPQAITLVIDKVSCPGEHVLTNQYILDDQVIYENGFVNDLKLVSPTTFNLEDCLISKRYNQLTESHKLVKKIKFVDEVMDYTLIVDRNCQVKCVPLVQTNSHKELSNSIAFDIRSQDFHYLIGVLMDDIIFGDKLYLMQGIKCKGKVIVYDKNNGKMSRLKN